MQIIATGPTVQVVCSLCRSAFCYPPADADVDGYLERAGWRAADRVCPRCRRPRP